MYLTTNTTLAVLAVSFDSIATELPSRGASSIPCDHAAECTHFWIVHLRYEQEKRRPFIYSKRKRSQNGIKYQVL